MDALASRERGQTHNLEQLRSLFVEQGSPIMGCGRPQVGGFNVRHVPRVSAESNATVMFPPILRFSDSLARPRESVRTKATDAKGVVVNGHTPLKVRAGRGVNGPDSQSRAARGAPLRGVAGRINAAAGRRRRV